MRCPECGSHPHESSAFCTACGADLLERGAAAEPVPVGVWTGGSAQPLDAATTEPILGPHPTASTDSTPVLVPRRPGPQRRTPVKEMVGSERAAWIDKVWGAAEEVEP